MPAVPPTQIDTRLAISGEVRPIRIAATWWAPTTAPIALLWLQHGFARSRRRMAALAAAYASSGMLVLTTSLRSADPFARTVQNLRDNTRFLDEIGGMLSGADEVLADSWSASRGATAIADQPLPDQLLLVGHSAGGDAVAYVAGRLVTTGARRASGVVLLDPVRSASGDNLATGLDHLSTTDTPVRIVAAAPSRCNAGGSGVTTALQHLSGFAGVRLTTGSHTDAEGADTDRLAARLCGAPTPDNVAALRSLSTAWLTEATGRNAAIAAGPESRLVTELVAAGRASVLWGHRGSTSTTR